MGQLSSEIDRNERIDEFICNGPKNYAIRVFEGNKWARDLLKLKGVRLNSDACRTLHFDSMRELLFVRPSLIYKNKKV